VVVSSSHLIVKVGRWPSPAVLVILRILEMRGTLFLMSNLYFWHLGQRPPALVIVLAFASGISMFYFSLRWEIEPVYVISVVTLVPLALFAMHKWPLVILAGLMFVGEFKTTPAEGISLTDPTMVFLLLLSGAIFLDLLFRLASDKSWTFGVLFKEQTAINIIFLLFCTEIAVGLLYTRSEAGAMKVARFETFEVLVFFSPQLLLKKKADVRQLLIAFAILGIVLSGQVVMDLLHPSELVLSGNEDITKIGISELLGFSVLFCLYGKLGRSVAVKYICVVILLFGLVACLTRTGLISLLISLIVSACVSRGGTGMLSRKRVFIGAVLVLLIAIPTLLWLAHLPAAQGKLRWKVGELVSLASGSTVSTGTVNSRLDFYCSALEALVQHPIIGLGVGGWSIFYYGEDVLHYPHNFLLEVGAEQGASGLIPLIVLFVLLFRSAFKALHFDHELAFTFPMLVFCSAYNLMTGNIESRPLWFVCGLCAAAARISGTSGLVTNAQS
jgi:O-antigen ligase